MYPITMLLGGDKDISPCFKQRQLYAITSDMHSVAGYVCEVGLHACRASDGRGRRRGWGPGSLAEAMMGMLGEDAIAGSADGRLPQPPSHIAGHLSAMRAAFAGMSSGRLPPHLLFSDRDFNEDDYEALLALDDTVENRKGELSVVLAAAPWVYFAAACACLLTCIQGCCFLSRML